MIWRACSSPVAQTASLHLSGKNKNLIHLSGKFKHTIRYEILSLMESEEKQSSENNFQVQEANTCIGLLAVAEGGGGEEEEGEEEEEEEEGEERKGRG